MNRRASQSHLEESSAWPGRRRPGGCAGLVARILTAARSGSVSVSHSDHLSGVCDVVVLDDLASRVCVAHFALQWFTCPTSGQPQARPSRPDESNPAPIDRSIAVWARPRFSRGARGLIAPSAACKVRPRLSPAPFTVPACTAGPHRRRGGPCKTLSLRRRQLRDRIDQCD